MLRFLFVVLCSLMVGQSTIHGMAVAGVVVNAVSAVAGVGAVIADMNKISRLVDQTIVDCDGLILDGNNGAITGLVPVANDARGAINAIIVAQNAPLLYGIVTPHDDLVENIKQEIRIFKGNWKTRALSLLGLVLSCAMEVVSAIDVFHDYDWIGVTSLTIMSLLLIFNSTCFVYNACL